MNLLTRFKCFIERKFKRFIDLRKKNCYYTVVDGGTEGTKSYKASCNEKNVYFELSAWKGLPDFCFRRISCVFCKRLIVYEDDKEWFSGDR